MEHNKVVFESKVSEIFESPEIKAIEIEILNLYYEINRRWEANERNKFAITRLLKIRKKLLDSKFVMDDYSKQLLSEFNEAMKQQLIIMRSRTEELYHRMEDLEYPSYMGVTGKCFLGYTYSTLHPIQTTRAKKMWAILNGTLDDFISIYNDGVTHCFTICNNGIDSYPNSENQLLFLDDKEGNWNEGLDEKLTNDMHLIYAFHNLWSHMEFSVYDLLWVRDFNIEISSEIDYETDSDDGDFLDWDKYDFTD